VVSAQLRQPRIAIGAELLHLGAEELDLDLENAQLGWVRKRVRINLGILRICAGLPNGHALSSLGRRPGVERSGIDDPVVLIVPLRCDFARLDSAHDGPAGYPRPVRSG
jgi:hypothetical protein